MIRRGFRGRVAAVQPGVPRPRDGLDGIFFVYQTSFSPHTLAVRPDLRSLKVLKSCPAKQVKSQTVKKGKQKGKTTLSCAKKS